VSGGEQIIEVVDVFECIISFLQITVKGLKLLDLRRSNAQVQLLLLMHAAAHKAHNYCSRVSGKLHKAAIQP
jgi:hypothetical protein